MKEIHSSQISLISDKPHEECGVFGIFDPNANVSYQEVLTFLNRYYVNYQKNPTSTGTLYGFSDANQVAGWALPYAQWAAGKGIVDYYYDGGLLKPTTAATRGDVALFLHRMLTL